MFYFSYSIFVFLMKNDHFYRISTKTITWHDHSWSILATLQWSKWQKKMIILIFGTTQLRKIQEYFKIRDDSDRCKFAIYHFFLKFWFGPFFSNKSGWILRFMHSIQFGCISFSAVHSGSSRLEPSKTVINPELSMGHVRHKYSNLFMISSHLLKLIF